MSQEYVAGLGVCNTMANEVDREDGGTIQCSGHRRAGPANRPRSAAPDDYAGGVSSTTVISTPTTAVAAAARRPATILATAAQAVTTPGAARRTSPDEWRAWVDAFLAGLPDLAGVAAVP